MPASSRRLPFGAEPGPNGRVRFSLWAPDAERVELVIEDGATASSTLEMPADDGGWCTLLTDAAAPGTRYRYRIDGELLVPDPASRFQPDGIAGPSQVVDPGAYSWQTRDWRGRPWRETVLYELHVGTFTPGGDFESAAGKLPYLAELGITAIELMPVATFAGRRGWGYDGVLPYAPHSAYGTPDAFRRFVDAAHALGIQVLLDVVYNHFGPEGNYLHAYASEFFTERHQTPWGAAINFDGANSRPVRDFFVGNALYWLEEFRLDGLRLDAVHAIADDSDVHLLDEIGETVRSGPGASREIHLVLENHANQARYLRPRHNVQAPYAAQWNDDFHHAGHALLTGEADGYYVDYADRALAHLARCLAEGFAYQGEPSRHADGRARGEPSADLPSTAFIAFLQNHDQVGNRARGERLTTLAMARPLRALTSLMLLAPSIPGLFMGEEFGCLRPFLYFVDFEGDLANAVREGRRREFASFEHFGDGDGMDIPDPVAAATFERSKLDWAALESREHADWLDFYRGLLAVRRQALVPRLPAAGPASIRFVAGSGVTVSWPLADGSRLALLANLGDAPIDCDADIPRGALLWAGPDAGDAQAADVGLAPWTVRWYLETEPP